jgi:hypothetical protein
MRGFNQLHLVGFVLLTACGGSTPPAEEPDDYAAVDDSPDDVEQTAAGEKASSPGPATEQRGGDSTAAPAEPEFKPGMSVNEAIDAVPPGVERANIEQDALARPLMDPKLYEPCKLGTSHFKLKVAVWDGKAVGIDLTTTPKNDKLTECLRNQIGQLEWQDKVKSLNTVEYQL